MGNARQSSTIRGVLNFGDMTVLAILILVIFGPDRMPELARKAGTMLSKARDTARVLREDLGTEYKEILEPIEDVRKTLKEARSEIRGIASEVAHQVGSVVDDVKAEVASVGDEARATVDEAKSSVEEALAEARKAVEVDKPMSRGGPTDQEAEESAPEEPSDAAELDDPQTEQSVTEQLSSPDGRDAVGIGATPPSWRVGPRSAVDAPEESQVADTLSEDSEDSAQGTDETDAGDDEGSGSETS